MAEKVILLCILYCQDYLVPCTCIYARPKHIFETVKNELKSGSSQVKRACEKNHPRSGSLSSLQGNISKI